VTGRLRRESSVPSWEFCLLISDELAKKEKQRHLVIPAKAGIQCFQEVAKWLDTGFQTLRQGLACFKACRVFEIDQQGDCLLARVEDGKDGLPVAVTIRLTEEGQLDFSCECAAPQGKPCLHQVAALHAYADQCGETNQLLGASDAAIKERVKRGRAEVRVESLDGLPWFGEWRASSLAATSHYPRQYRVSIRSLHRRANLCTCPDFAVNQLGTCKHIEAVLHQIAKHPDFERFRRESPPLSYVYLAWDVPEAPRLRLYRAQVLAPDLAGLLDVFFDADGMFHGRLPDGYFRLREMVGERDDIRLGEDATEYARQLATTEAQRRRSEEIRGLIRTGGGRLPGVRTRLYPYQVEGVAFLAGTGRALLADDMGLGKTLQAIAAAAWLREHEGVRRVLIVCPASLKQQWAREIDKFTGLSSQIVQGNPAERTAQYRREAVFFLVNYELVLRDLSLLQDMLRPDLVIMDEAQRIKNWRTKIAAAVKRIPCRYAFVLTGTPLENRLEDLYSLLQVVDARVLGPLWRYLVDFHITDERGKVLGYRNLSLLRQRIAPVMLRRDRSLVRDQLPDRIVQRLDVGMTQQQRELHDAALSNAGRLATIARRRPLTPTEQNRLMAALQQARMACNAAGLVDKESEGSPKLDELVDLLDELCLQSGLKAVVFSQWEQMTRMAQARLTALGLGCVRLHGGVPTAHRGALMDRFREDDAIQVFISTDAGGVGLNLQSGSVLVNLDVPWNPAVLEQRNARVHRLGQTRTVQIITMVAAASYEERVLALVQGKQQLFDNVVRDDASEDVVGISRKLLETLIEDLAEPATREGAEAAVGEAGEEVPPMPADGIVGPEEAGEAADDRLEREITACVEEVQRAFGVRIERILGAGGGLLVVLDRVDAAADALAARLSHSVPVALVDRLTLNGLARLGAASPVAGARTYFDGEQAGASGGQSRLALLAAEKLRAAAVLLEQGLGAGAQELLLSALLAAAADRAGQDEPVNPREAGVWLYGEALPKGYLAEQEAALLLRGIGLAQSPSVPLEMLRALALDAETFLASGMRGDPGGPGEATHGAS